MTLLFWLIGIIVYISIGIIAVLISALFEAEKDGEPSFDDKEHIALLWPLFFVFMLVLIPIVLFSEGPKWIYKKLKDKKTQP